MRLRVALVSLAIASIAMVARGTPAFAEYSSHPLYQIALSSNCNNPKYCGQFLGGFWGWAVLNVDGSMDGEFTGCGHLERAGGAGAGASHLHVDAEWFSGKNGDFWTKNETDTAVGRGGTTTSFTAKPQDTMIPAHPGHYNTQEVVGFSAPGVSFQLQVVLIPQNGKFSSAGASSGAAAASLSGSSAKLTAAAFKAAMTAKGYVSTRFGWVRLGKGPRLTA